MKKIGLFLETEPHFGGTFQYNQSMLDAVAALPRDQFSVVVGFTSEKWRGYLTHYENLKAVQIPRGFWGRIFGLAWLLLRVPMGPWRKLCPLFHPMAKALLRENCDLWIFPSQDIRSFQFPVPALVSILDLVHRYDGKQFPESASTWQLLNREPGYANMCKWAKGVLVVSEIDKQQVLESYHPQEERVHVLPMVPPRYMYTQEVPEDFNTRYPLPPKYLFYPAQFWEHKNHKNLVRAIAALKTELPDLRLVLAGSKKNAWDSVMALIEELGVTENIVILGYVPDEYMPELYRRARALIYATYFGPCNIPPLEALVVGCPMAISEVSCMPDRVGDATLTFDADSVEQIMECMRRLWTDDGLCAEMSEKGKAKAAIWDQEAFNKELKQIVEEIA
ncbi:MAG: glycosyltransferase family 1 protein [Deltaproteobacteria bacterium HGW-Deltaproteobacteria-4]|nr:MAG: glycosyltransferase family 1 protein [Deltaproteobacteria bacterium HGW-Deltaproteobacteria-4]